MRFSITIILLFVFQINLFAQEAFITTWKTNYFKDEDSKSIEIPTRDGYEYDYDVDWENDGVYDVFNVTGNINHEYPNIDTVQVAIRGKFPTIHFASSRTFWNAYRLVSIDQWGTGEWATLKSSFSACARMTLNATDAPVLNENASLIESFVGCSRLSSKPESGDFSNWDVSMIDSMSGMFASANMQNADLSNWDVSNVKDMSDMFSLAQFSEKSIGMEEWDVSNVESMNGMFIESFNFNQDISNWDVGNVRDMGLMFFKISEFNQDLSMWDVGNLRNAGAMFYSCNEFNSDLSNWKVDNVTNFSNMLLAAESFDQNLGSWNFNDSIISMQRFLGGSGLSVENYDSTIIGWHENNFDLDSLTIGVSGLMYCASADERQDLIENRNWIFIGDSAESDDCTVSVYEPRNELKVYPNPTSDKVYFNKKTAYSLFNIQGREVMSGNSSFLDLSHLRNGVYILRTQYHTEKVVKE